MKYEDHVRKVCGESWRTIDEQEAQGGYGVACMKAYLQGVKPSLPEISKHLGVTPDEIGGAFIRLLRNGAFNRDSRRQPCWDAKNDHQLNNDREIDYPLWAFVAAVASGFLGTPC